LIFHSHPFLIVGAFINIVEKKHKHSLLENTGLERAYLYKITKDTLNIQIFYHFLF